MATAREYTVRLAQFEGPMDLLLHLIMRAEVDISAISVARIADQYLEHLEQLDRIDVEDAGDFLVLAASLIEIKSRLLSPEKKPGEGDGGEGNADAGEPGEPGNRARDLVRQLLAFKAYRDAAAALDDRRAPWLRRYPAGRAGFDKEALRAAVEPAEGEAPEIEDVELVDLIEAFQRIADTVQFDRLGEHSVEDDETPIELHAADIADRLEREPASRPGGAGVTLRSIFEGRTRGEMVGLFLALLELVRQRRVSVWSGGEEEASPGEGILLRLREEEAEEGDEEDRGATGELSV